MAPDDAPRPGRAPSPATSPATSASGTEPAWLQRMRRATRLDLRPGTPPSTLRWASATVLSMGLSLALCALAVHVAVAEYPSTRGFSHFQISDYGTLTLVGVLCAASGWAALVRLSSVPRKVYLRLALVVTLLLWVPDLWIYVQGESPKGVATLMVMHLLIAVVTYNVVVRVAAPGASPAPSPGSGDAPASLPLHLSERAVRRIWSSVALLVGLELALGVSVIVSVPFRRPAAIVPARGTWVYVAHGAVGIALGFAALAVLVLSPLAGRIGRIGAVMGAVGVVIGLAGGVLATYQHTRLLGMAVMLVGVVVAAVGFLAPSLEAVGKAEAERARAARAALVGARALGQEAGLRPGPGGGSGGGSSSDEGVSTNGHAASPPSR